MGSRISPGKCVLAIAVLAFALGAHNAFAKAAHNNTTATDPAAMHSAKNAPDFDPGLWKVVISAHIWGPINKHTAHKECWQSPRPQLRKVQVAKKCKLQKTMRHGNTYTVDITCPTKQGTSHIHFSRTYAGNSATETGTVQLKNITAHIKVHAKRIGKCPAAAKN